MSKRRNKHHKPSKPTAPVFDRTLEASNEPISTEEAVPNVEYKPHKTKREKVWKKPESPVAVATLFAGIAVALIYLLQLRTMQQTLLIDQRPWIKISAEANAIVTGSPVTAKMHIINYGKTPARSVRFDFVIEKVVNGEQPTFDYPEPHAMATVGMIYPNDPADITAGRLNPAIKEKPVQLPISAEEATEFSTGKIFFVIYGNATYSDFDNVKHWTHYCSFFVSPNWGHATAKKCTDYNEIDNN